MTVATDYNEKLAILEQAIENNPHDYQPWFEKSKILFELQRLDEALISIEKVLNICPDDLDIQLLKGEILADRGEFENALSYFENIIDQGSASPWILYLKGYSLQGLEYFKEAINVYKGIFESYPGQVNEALAVMIHLELGECLNQIKRYYEALAEYDKAILINPNDSTARYRRGTLLTFFIDDEGSSQRAIEDLDFVINNLIPEEEPHRIITYFIRAIAKNNSNDYIGAIEDFSIYLQYKPDEYSSYLYRSDAYGFMGKYQEAINDLYKSAEISLAKEDINHYEKVKLRLKQLGIDIEDKSSQEQELTKPLSYGIEADYSTYNSDNILIEQYYSLLARLDLKNRELFQAKEDYQWHDKKLQEAYSFGKKIGVDNISSSSKSNTISFFQIEKNKVEMLVSYLHNLALECHSFLVHNEEEEKNNIRISNNTIESLKHELSTTENSLPSNDKEIIRLEHDLILNESKLDSTIFSTSLVKNEILYDLTILLVVAIVSALLFKHLIPVIISSAIILYLRRE
ncbi:MAG: tetratricopeptide repeat protein [Xenococcaceae cyanobacterium MO_188.B19]|nr:tetratricopeptide repeat protein [Xenococcaceae cyanobacterium MO_188.B19]